MANAVTQELIDNAKEVLSVVKLIVENPDEVEINVVPSKYKLNLELYTNVDDIGLVIGKGGHILDSIRSLLVALSGKHYTPVYVDYITEMENRDRRKQHRE